MRNIASILGLFLPSSLCVALVLCLKHDLSATSSGEVAAGLIVGGTAMVLGLFALSCIPNLICILVAVQRKETLWKLSVFGMPLCGVLTTLTVALLK
jgi:hypothetical protein